MIVFTCYDTFDDMMTCIYDAWAARLGHSNIRLQTEPLGNLELFCEYRHIDADREKVRKVIRSIQNKISYQAFYDVYAASLSCESNKPVSYTHLTADLPESLHKSIRLLLLKMLFHAL